MMKCFPYRRILLFILMSIAIFSSAQTPKWQDLYKVKKKDTVYGIAHKYGITVEELQKANPNMGEAGYVLKKGDQLLIPYPSSTPSKSSVSTTSTVAKPINDGVVHIGVMLPLHNDDGDGQRMTEYYRGLLMACDSLRAKGISTTIHAWNVPIDADVRQTLLEDEASKCNIIFGPLYSKQVKPLADFCKTYGIRMVIPFSITGNDVATNSQIFQVYQSADKITESSIDAFMERFPQCHPVFIDCNDTTSRKGSFTFGLRKKLDAKGIKYSITNLKSSEEYFAKAFSGNTRNVVILNTARSPELNIALAKIDGLKTINPQLQISLYGYTEWLMYTKVYLEYFYKYDTYIPTTFYYNPLSARTKDLETAYRKWFHQDMRVALPRFAIVGYDHARFFVEGLYKYGANFSGTKGQIGYAPMQSPLNFKRVGEGGMQNKCFMLVHYKTNHSMESISY